MATLGTYYFDTASFANATTIYDDANLTTVAANGFYSDNSIVREQVSGVLFAGQSCAVPTPPSPPPSPTYSLTLYANVSSGTNPLQGWGTSTEACNGTGTPVTVYLGQNVSSLQDAYNNGYVLYINNTLTTPYAGGSTYFKDVSSPST